MKRDGYKIIRYIRGIYWNRSAKIFDDFVTKLYNKRVEVDIDTSNFSLHPAMSTSMRRKYFLSLDGTFRSTYNQDTSDTRIN